MPIATLWKRLLRDLHLVADQTHILAPWTTSKWGNLSAKLYWTSTMMILKKYLLEFFVMFDLSDKIVGEVENENCRALDQRGVKR